MKKLNLNSRRTYCLLFSEGNITGVLDDVTLERIITNCEDLEIFHSVNDSLDKVLDLSISECMIFQPRRDGDEKHEKGIITRIR